MTIQPLRNQVVILPLPAEERSPGGIFIPDPAQQNKQQGTVVALGPGDFVDFMYSPEAGAEVARYKPCPLQIGDMVLYSKYAGARIKLMNVEYEIMASDNVYAILQSAEQVEVAA